MMATIAIAAATAALMAGTYGLSLHQHGALRRRQLQGIEWISGLAGLTALLQRHRGLSNGIKHGGQGLEGQIGDIEAAIAIHWKQLDAGGIGRQHPSVTVIREQCQSMLDQWRQMPAALNLNEHNRLISSIIHQLEDIALGHHLNASFLTGFPAVDILWRELLLTVETIGQFRALGTGIAAEGQCSSVQRIRLSFLTRKCELLSRSLVSSIGKIRCTGEESENLVKLVEGAHGKFMTLQQLAQRELLDSVRVTLGSEQFFQQASQVMDQYVQAFAAGLQSARRAVRTTG